MLDRDGSPATGDLAAWVTLVAMDHGTAAGHEALLLAERAGLTAVPADHTAAQASLAMIGGDLTEALRLAEAAEQQGATTYAVVLAANLRALAAVSRPGRRPPTPSPPVPGSLLAGMVAYHAGETALLDGDPAAAAEIPAALRRDGTAHPAVAEWLGLAESRSLLHLGRVDEAGALLDELDARASCGDPITPVPALPGLGEGHLVPPGADHTRNHARRSLRCLELGLRGDVRGARALAEAWRDRCVAPYTFADACWSLLSAMGVAAAGMPRLAATMVRFDPDDPALRRFPPALRVYALDLLVESALVEHNLDLARWIVADLDELALDASPLLVAIRAGARERVAAHAAGAGAGEATALRVARDAALRVGGVLDSARAGAPVAAPLLTATQEVIAAMVATGMRNREIADTLILSVRTVESHVSAILAALGVRSRAGVAAALEHQAPGDRTAPAARDGLTPRQRQVATLVARGRTNAEIAADLGIGRKAVEKHVAALFVRLGVSTRAGVAHRLGRPSPHPAPSRHG